MNNLSPLELNTIHSDYYIKLQSHLHNTNNERVGELGISILDENIKDIQAAADKLEPVSTKTINSFQLTYDGYIYEQNIKPFDRTPFIIWGRIALVDRFYIYPPFRKKGYGRQTIKLLITALKEIYHVDFIILKPYPLFGSEDESITERVPTKKYIAERINSLVPFYESIGFKTQKVNKQFYQCLCLLDYIDL
ncbi:hypothetical protein QTG56_23550 (plasmid) [Rossellomorea sp. AcN35-11]|nr:hypothetical protein [Rossellomorea aquimaris]WJV32340.1 hypothetical protein QTG56_23550 [Rossellomorea sp. AcN35-11]